MVAVHLRQMVLPLHMTDVLLQAGEHDWCAAMATVSCILHASFDNYDWTVRQRLYSCAKQIISMPAKLECEL